MNEKTSTIHRKTQVVNFTPPKTRSVSVQLASSIESARGIISKIIPEQENAIVNGNFASVEELATTISLIVSSRIHPKKDSEIYTYADGFLSELREQFFRGRLEIDSALWERLRKTEFFLEYIGGYIARHIGNIFQHRDTESVYNEIEFALYLLGAPERLDIVTDMQSQSNALLDKLVNSHYKDIISDSSILKRISDEMDEWDDVILSLRNQLDSKIGIFIQLMETINKAIFLHAVGNSGRTYSINLAKSAERSLRNLSEHFGEINFHSNKTKELIYELGKYLVNYSHLEYFEWRNAKEIREKAETIRKNISQGLDLLDSVGYLNNEIARYYANMVARGNTAYVNLLEIEKLTEKGFVRDIDIEEKRQICLQVLREIYLEEIPVENALKELSKNKAKPQDADQKLREAVQSSAQDKSTFDSSEKVLEYFLDQDKDPDNVKLETIHHLILFDRSISFTILGKIALYLSSGKPYKNIYHEEYRIKTLSVILRKLSSIVQADSSIGDSVANYLEQAIENHSPISEHPYAYLALAIFYASRFRFGMNREENRAKANLAFTHFYYLDPGLPFDEEKKNFFAIISEMESEYFRKLQAAEKENEIREEFSKITDWINKNEITTLDEAVGSDYGPPAEPSKYTLENIYSLIRKLFYNIPLAREDVCPHCLPPETACKSCDFHADCAPIQRGNTEKKIPYGESKHLQLVYPTNMELAFMRIFEDEKEFIAGRMENIERALLVNKEKRENRKRLQEAEAAQERASKTKHLSGLPNGIAFEIHLQNMRMAEKKGNFFMLRIENSNRFHSDAIKSFANSRIPSLLQQYPGIEIFHLADNEFMFIFDDIQLPASEIAKRLKLESESFRFAVGNHNRRPIVRVAYSLSDNQGVYAKLGNTLDRSDIGTIEFKSPENTDDSEDASAETLEDRLLEQIEYALENWWIVPYYQEIRSSRSAKTHQKFECLLRIFDGEEKMLPLGKCLEIAEEYGLTKEITIHMLELIAKDMRQRPEAQFSINVCPSDLRDRDFIKELLLIIDREWIEKRIIIELVETPLKYGDETVIENLPLFSEKGIQIAIDDYGQRASGLDRVKKMNPSYVKLDRIFAEELRLALARKKLRSIADLFIGQFSKTSELLSGRGQHKPIEEEAFLQEEQRIVNVFEDAYLGLRSILQLHTDEHKKARVAMHDIETIIQESRIQLSILERAHKEKNSAEIHSSVVAIQNLVDALMDAFKRLQIAFKGKEEDSATSLDIAIKDIRYLVETLHARGMEVIAEFVETEDVADLLRELEVDWLQGYFYSKPAPASRL